MNKIVFIYGLFDPLTNELRYVGKSINPIIRLRKHISERNLHDSYKDRWLRKLYGINLKPELIIIDEVCLSNWQFWESFYIEYFKSIGCRLTNGTLGGDQPPSTKGRKHTEYSKEKMSKTKKGKPIPWLNNGDVRTQKHIDNLSKSLKGRKSERLGKTYEQLYGDDSDRLKKKLSESHIGIQAGENHPMFNKHHSDETRNKLSKHFSKPVIQLSLNNEYINEYESAKIAEEKTGVPFYTIKNICNGRIKKSKQYKWRYK